MWYTNIGFLDVLNEIRDNTLMFTSINHKQVFGVSYSA